MRYRLTRNAKVFIVYALSISIGCYFLPDDTVKVFNLLLYIVITILMFLIPTIISNKYLK